MFRLEFNYVQGRSYEEAPNIHLKQQISFNRNSHLQKLVDLKHQLLRPINLLDESHRPNSQSVSPLLHVEVSWRTPLKK